MSTTPDLLGLALRSYQAGDFRSAEHLCRQFLQVQPGHPQAWCLLGAACHRQGRLSEAVAGYREAHVNRALVWLRTGTLEPVPPGPARRPGRGLRAHRRRPGPELRRTWGDAPPRGPYNSGMTLDVFPEVEYLGLPPSTDTA